MLTRDCGWPIGVFCAVLVGLPLLAVQAQEDNHFLSQVLFCQPNPSAPGLLKMFDEDQIFHYNFTNQSTSSWLPDFDQWSDQAFPNALNISNTLKLCNSLRNILTEYLVNITPEARGGNHMKVLTAYPLRIGKPNTLICFINDVYPPALTITWRKHAKELVTGLNPSGYYAMGDLTFQAFSYLNVTPYYDDIYSCEVQVAGDNNTLVSYWVPDFPVPSDVLENALCGLGIALGIVFFCLGCTFFCISKKLRDID